MQMYIKVKVGTLVILAGLVALCTGIVYATWDNPTPDRLASLIIESSPNHGDRIDVTPRGYSYTSPRASKRSDGQLLEDALTMIEEYPDHVWTKAQGAYTLGHLYLKMGEREQALAWFKQAVGVNEEAARWVEMLEPAEASPEKLSLSGRILLDGEPGSNVIVYLRPVDTDHWYSPGYLRYPAVMTDSDGEYRIYGASPGRYEVGVAVLPEQLEGLVRTESPEETVSLVSGSPQTLDVRFVPKLQTVSPGDGTQIDDEQLRFVWEPYPGAASYRLNIQSIQRDEQGRLSGTTTHGLQESWTGTEAVYTVDELRGYAEGIHYDMHGPVPSAILGIVYPGGLFSWSVDAYDEQGLKLSSSSTYYAAYAGRLPIFSMSDRDRLAGDRYVLVHDWERAIEAYQQEEDREDAIRALGRIYAIGTDSSGADKDPELALAYLRRLKDPAPYDLNLMDYLAREEPTE